MADITMCRDETCKKRERFDYRIKPNPDVVRYYIKCRDNTYEMLCGEKNWDYAENWVKRPQVKVVYDGETGHPKSAEVLK